MQREKLMVFTILFLFAIPSIAVEYNGLGKVTYSGFLDDAERIQAKNAAKVNAVESWIYKHHPYHAKTFENIKSEIVSELDSYFLSVSETGNHKDSAKNLYQVTVRTDINETKLLNKLVESGRNTESHRDDQYITMVFVARELVAKTTKDEKASIQTKAQSKIISSDVDDDIAEQSKSQAKTIKQQNTSTQFKDILLWDAATTNEVDAALGAVFSNANYFVIDAAILEEETNGKLKVSDFVSDYKHGNDLQGKTKGNAVRGLKSLSDPVQYLAIGTLDIDEYLTDGVSGLIKVPVVVTAQVLAINKRGAAVAKVGPIQYIGLGPTPIVAKNNALKQAAEEAAQSLIAQLSAKSI